MRQGIHSIQQAASNVVPLGERPGGRATFLCSLREDIAALPSSQEVRFRRKSSPTICHDREAAASSGISEIRPRATSWAPSPRK